MRRDDARLGALMVGAFALLVLGVLWLRAPAGRTYYAALPTAEGLQEGSPVRYLGQEVGTVKRIELTARADVRLTLSITRDDAPMLEGMSVRATPVGIFGDGVLELVPPPRPGGRRLPESSTIAPTPHDSLAAARTALARAVLGEIVRGVRDRRDSSGGPPRDSLPDSTSRRR